MAFFFGLDDVDLAVELCSPALNLLGRFLVEVDHRPLVGRHPLLRDAQQGPENADQESEDLLDHDLEKIIFVSSIKQIKLSKYLFWDLLQ